jgi:DNA-binding winged helix-turn-helix (wHTH) protein/TolB-like protein/Tfp pilus assembly protein PilF
MNIESKKIREFGKFRLDTEQKVLWREHEIVSMPLKELEVLSLLVENKGKLVTKRELLDRIWTDSFVEENNLSRHIYLLRKKLKTFGADNLIENVPRRGYRFTGEVREVSEAAIIIEKHTRTLTLIEFEEEKTTEDDSARKTGILRHVFSTRRYRPAVWLAAILILLGGAFVFSPYRGSFFGASASEIRSIAVLPFQTIDANGENGRQGVGLTDILITRLSSIRTITVRPTGAVLNFEQEDPISAGQKLKTDAVLEGAVYRAGEKVRVTTRLIKVSDGTVIWNGQFERLKTDELRLQDEIALQVVGALALNLSGGEKNSLTRQFTEDPDAFELYQKGRFEWNKRSWQSMVEAERLFRNAIDKDPKFALAYVGLADTLSMRNGVAETELAVLKALELDPTLAEAYAALGFSQTFHQWNWQAAEESFKKSIELNPNYATAHHWYAQVLAIQGRHDEAKAEMRRALEINPLSYNFLADLGQIYYFNREYGEAEEYCRKALEIYPDFVFAHEYLSDIYLKTGEYEKALDEMLAAQKTMSTFTNEPKKVYESRISSYKKDIENFPKTGIKKYIESQLAGFPPEPGYYPILAGNYAFLGEKEKALASLEKAFQGKGFLTVFIKADPIFDDLRGDPRYQEILRKMNLF